MCTAAGVDSGAHTGFSSGDTTFRVGPHADGPLAQKGATDDEDDFCRRFFGNTFEEISVDLFLGTASLKVFVDIF